MEVKVEVKEEPMFDYSALSQGYPTDLTDPAVEAEEEFLGGWGGGGGGEQS